MSFITACTALLCLFHFAVGASTQPYGCVYVSPFGSDTNTCTSQDYPCRTVRAAAAILRGGGLYTIYLMPGAYYGDANFVSLDLSTVSMISTTPYDPSQVIFDAQRRSSLSSLRINATVEGSYLTIQGVTFANWPSRTDADDYGAVEVGPGSNLLIKNCAFSNSRYGVSVSGGTATIRDSVFTGVGSSTTDTSGINVPSVDNNNTWLTVSNCTFQNLYYGIYVAQANTNVVVKDSTFYNNGNGLSFSTYLGTCFATISNCVFNASTGSAIDIASQQADAQVRVAVSDSVFSGCGSMQYNMDGGAISVSSYVEADVQGCTFADNTGYYGAALYCDDQGVLNVQASTFTGNVASDGSPGSCESLCAFNAINNKLSNNTATRDTNHCRGL